MLAPAAATNRAQFRLLSRLSGPECPEIDFIATYFPKCRAERTVTLAAARRSGRLPIGKSVLISAPVEPSAPSAQRHRPHVQLRRLRGRMGCLFRTAWRDHRHYLTIDRQPTALFGGAKCLSRKARARRRPGHDLRRHCTLALRYRRSGKAVALPTQFPRTQRNYRSIDKTDFSRQIRSTRRSSAYETGGFDRWS